MSDSSRAVRCIGAGISGGGTDAVLVQWLYSHEDAEPVQLRAVGVFRGAPGWSRPVSSDAEHARELRGAGTRIGYELAHTTLWLEVDPLNATVNVGDTVVPWLPPDAIHAFTIDRIDHVGGPPIVTHLTLPAPPRAAVRAASLFKDMSVWARHVRTFADRAPLLGRVP